MAYVHGYVRAPCCPFFFLFLGRDLQLKALGSRAICLALP
jgi:hypothetical protein